MADPNIADVDVPHLCGCGHDEAYHFRQVFVNRTNDQGQAYITIGSETGCTTCLCPQYGTGQKRYVGTGVNAPKDWGNR